MIQRGLVFLIRSYQASFAPFLGSQCRFYPSCSRYATEALAKYTPGTAILKIARRVLHCHPWHPGGVDLP